MSIPRIIHQTWKTADIPAAYRGFQRNWTRHHPDHAYRLWTDEDLDRLVADDFPHLLPLYRSYREPISRADLGRYLVLLRHGGIYADLDCDCLRPLRPLVDGAEFVIGTEPASHLALDKAVRRGLTRILCPSVIASVPGHPFWHHVVGHIVAARDEEDVLDATGPFLMTRACDSFGEPHRLTVLPPHVFYPADKDDCWKGRVFDLEFWERTTRDAYALHYWDGTWFRGGAVHGRLPTDVRVQVSDPVEAGPPPGPHAGDRPLISCLMVTRERAGLAGRAIDAFLAQSWPNRELVIVDDGPDDALAARVRTLGRPEIRMLRLPDEGRTLGELRNIALDHAAGAYVCQWDDDDLYDPQRLEYQLAVLSMTGARACLLSRWTMWWPASGRVAISPVRDWEGSLLCERAAMPRYPALRRGEDTPVVERLRRTVRVAALDLPRLYTYVVHGANTFDPPHFETHWRHATARFEGERGRAVLEELASRLPMLELPPPVAYAAVHGAAAAEPDPAVLVLTPVKDAARHLPRYFQLLDRLSYDPSRLSLGLLESDSTDGTYELLSARLPELRTRFRRITLLRHDFGFHPTVPRWDARIQRERRAVLARARNRLLSGALADEAWVLWLDVDLIDYPSDLLKRLLGAGRDIVVPHCVLPDGRTFDLNTFRIAPGCGPVEDTRHLLGGIYQPPRGAGRLYLDAFSGEGIVPVDAVGGTALLVRADLHREGLCFPPYPHRGYIETEGLAAMAADMGSACWGMPDLRIVHSDT